MQENFHRISEVRKPIRIIKGREGRRDDLERRKFLI